MPSYYVWFAVAVLLVIAELASGTFYLLMVALGLAAGGVGALSGLDSAVQTLLAAAVAVVGIILLRRTRFGNLRRGNPSTDPDVNLDIGQEVDVAAWDDNRRARVPYRGADWNVELAEGGAAAPGRFRIVEIRGSTLIVARR